MLHKKNNQLNLHKIMLPNQNYFPHLPNLEATVNWCDLALPPKISSSSPLLQVNSSASTIQTSHAFSWTLAELDVDEFRFFKMRPTPKSLLVQLSTSVIKRSLRDPSRAPTHVQDLKMEIPPLSIFFSRERRLAPVHLPDITDLEEVVPSVFTIAVWFLNRVPSQSKAKILPPEISWRCDPVPVILPFRDLCLFTCPDLSWYLEN